ncbi:hypothetical protein ACWCQZ_45130 [Streptomyces sp. NPDC002285]
MTPFMLSVKALMEGDRPPEPETELSRTRPVAIATDVQVIVRSLAEQLVCEANAILREHGTTLSLVDDLGPGGLAFTVDYGDRSARVQTKISDRIAVSCVVASGLTSDEPRQLTSEDEMRALLLSLIAAPCVDTQSH